MKGRLHHLIHRKPKSDCATCVADRDSDVQGVRQGLDSNFFSLSPDMLCVAGFDGYLKDVNRGWMDTLGFSKAELLGRPFLEFVHEADRAATSEAMAKLSKGGRISGFENRYVCKDGSYRWFRWHAVAAGKEKLIYAVACDLTDRHDADKARDRLAALVDSAEDAIISKTLDGVITSWNAGAERLYGYSAAEAVGKPISMLAPPDRADEIERLLEQVRQGRPVEHFETIRRRKDGRDIAVSLTISPVKDKYGKIDGASAIARDIGDRVRAGERASWLASFPEQDPNPVAEIDLAGCVVYMNPAALRLFPGLKGQGILHPWLAGIERILGDFRKGIIDKAEREVDLDGRWCRQSISYTAKSRTARIFGLDITEHKQLEEALQQSKKYLYSIIDTIGDPVFVKDQMHRYVLVNAACCRFFGRSREDILGRTGAEFFPEQDVKDSWAQDDRILAAGGPEIREAQVSDGAGRPCTIRLVKTVYTDIIGSKLLVGAFADISAQKKIEEELKESSKLKSDLISLVNHEYANVLTNVKLALSLLKSTETGAPDEIRSHSYEVLDKAFENLKAYTSNFLSLHRLESGTFELHLQPTAVRAAVLDALVTLRPLAEAKRQRMRIECAFREELPIAVRADRDCLSLIVNNLVSNAIKYTPEAGSITIRMDLVGGGGGPGGALRGDGHRHRDTGLRVGADKGRVLSHGRGPAHGQGLWSRAESGHGSPGEAWQPARHRERAGQGVSVLVPAARVGGLKLLAGRRIDLLLTDVVLPGMDGTELAAKLKALRPDLKTVFMSGYPGGAAGKIFGAGDNVFLEKPVSPEKLLATLRQVLDSRQGV